MQVAEALCGLHEAAKFTQYAAESLGTFQILTVTLLQRRHKTIQRSRSVSRLGYQKQHDQGRLRLPPNPPDRSFSLEPRAGLIFRDADL